MNSTKMFKKQLADYKEQIDADVNAYCADVNQKTLQTYGEHSQIVSNAYTELLKRGGKRIRGMLTIVGYEMCGGTDKQMIVQAARAIEMMHAYMLIIDDIQDRAEQRRGGLSTHKLLEAKHAEYKWTGDPAHSGISLALNAALLGLHGAELTLSNLNVPDELRIKALNIMNHTMVVTTHGQTHDIINEVAGGVSLEDIDKIMQWKSAHYSFLNPIHTGMVLAGAPCEDTNAITQYALNTGKAFQVSDDLMVLSDDNTSGKNPADDIREGKRTLLSVYALENAPAKDAAFLKTCLGNRNVSKKDIERCKEILIDSGAATYAEEAAQKYATDARNLLNGHATRWNTDCVAFLNELTNYVLK